MRTPEIEIVCRTSRCPFFPREGSNDFYWIQKIKTYQRSYYEIVNGPTSYLLCLCEGENVFVNHTVEIYMTLERDQREPYCIKTVCAVSL